MTSRDTYTLAFRLVGNEEDARDVVQEAYLRAYKGIGKFRGDAQFTTWLYRITANCANTHLKRRRHRPDELTRRIAADRYQPRRDPLATHSLSSLRDRLTVALRRDLRAQAAGRRGAPRRLRPAPRGDRRPSSASARRRPRSGSTGPVTKLREAGLPVPTATRRLRVASVSVCDEIADLLAASADLTRADRPAGPQATSRVLPALPGRGGPVPQAAEGAALAAR